MNEDFNPPAFPLPTGAVWGGMSMLDWFAGQALVGMLAAGPELRKDFMKAGVPEEDAYAHYAYYQALAMLKERQRLLESTETKPSPVKKSFVCNMCHQPMQFADGICWKCYGGDPGQ